MAQGQITRALTYVATNNICSIAAAGFGMMAMKKVLSAK